MRSFIITELICSSCGSRFQLPRTLPKQKPIGHVKDLWCPTCYEVTKYIEIGNLSLTHLKYKYDNGLELCPREERFLQALSQCSSSIDTIYDKEQVLHKKL